MKYLKIFTVFIIIFLVSCNKNSTSNYDYDYIVIMDATGGKIGNYNQRNIYVKNNSILPIPGEEGMGHQIPEAIKQGYNIEGWYTGIKEENGKITYLDKWNFKKDKVTSDLILYANWKENYKFTVLYGTDKNILLESETKDVIIKRPNEIQDPFISGYTFYDYYLDENLTTPFEFNKKYDFLDENGNEIYNINIYTKWLEGKFKIIRTASDMLRFNETANLYIDNNIDFEGKTVNFPENFSGSIIGNNYVLKNISIQKIKLGNTNSSFGLFNILDGAQIKDITFDNINVTIQIGLGNRNYIGILAGRLIGNTKIINVMITNSNTTVEYEDVSLDSFVENGLFAEKSSSVVIENLIDNNNNINFIKKDED